MRSSCGAILAWEAFKVPTLHELLGTRLEYAAILVDEKGETKLFGPVIPGEERRDDDDEERA